MKKGLTLLLLGLCLFTANGQNNFSSYFNQAATQMQQDNYKGAIESLSKALENKKTAKNNYQVANALLYRGYCRFQLNNTTQALDDINAAIELKPEFVKCYTMKCLILQYSRRFEDCLASAEAGLKVAPGDADLLLYKSKALNGLKRYTEAKTPLLQILAEQPKNLDALKYLGSVNNSQHHWDSAVTYFSRVIEIDPQDANAYYDRGISLSFLNDYENAKTDIEKGMQLDTASRFIGYNNLGFFLKLETKDYQGAIEYFDKAIQLNPQFAYAYSNRGFAKLNLGDPKGALKDLKKSLQLDNTNSYAYKNLGLIYLRTNKKKDACEQFNRAIELGYSETYDNEVNELLKANCQ